MTSPEFIAANKWLLDQYECGIEVKRVQFVGDIGKNGGHEVPSTARRS